MYQRVLDANTALPNTGNSNALTIAAVVTVAVGVAIVVSIVIRLALKKAHQA